MNRRLIMTCLILTTAWSAGCGTLSPPSPGGDAPTDGDLMDGLGDQVPPLVVLSVSNPTPQVNEELVLTCSVVGGGSADTFAFQPGDGRLRIDARRGTANLIVQQTDVGIALSFTCTATNEAGTSDRSNVELVTPTAPL